MDQKFPPNSHEFHLEYLEGRPGDTIGVCAVILVVIASFVTFTYCVVSGIGDILRSLCCCVT